jgi:hypothetical protein
MSLNVGDQEYNSGKKYRQKGALCGPNSDVSDAIYMEQPQGFLKDSYLVCRLKKSLYGLKKAPRAWYAKMDSYLLS